MLITVVGIMGAGMLLGFLLRQRKKLISANERLITYAIYLLLFMMGVSIGSNQQIMGSLSSLGITALVVSVGAVVGSILLGFFVSKIFFKSK